MLRTQYYIGCIWKFVSNFVSPKTALGNSHLKVRKTSRKHLLRSSALWVIALEEAISFALGFQSNEN